MKTLILLLTLASVAYAQDDCCQFYSNATDVVSDPCVKNATECNATSVLTTIAESNCSASNELICCEYSAEEFALTTETCCLSLSIANISIANNSYCGYGNETITWTIPTTGSTTVALPADDDSSDTSPEQLPWWAWLLISIGAVVFLLAACLCFWGMQATQ